MAQAHLSNKIMTPTTQNKNKIQIREIKEIAIAIAIKDFNPSRITAEFIKENNLVNGSVLTQTPYINRDRAQLIFDNGVTILAQPNGIAFIQRISDNNARLQMVNV